MSTGHKQERGRRAAAAAAAKEQALVEAKAPEPQFQVLALLRKIIGATTILVGLHMEMAFPGGVGSLPGETDYDQAEQHLTQSTMLGHLMDLQREAGHLTRYIDEPEKMKMEEVVARIADRASSIVGIARSMCDTFSDLHPQMVAKMAIMGQTIGNFNIRLTSVDLKPSLIQVVPG